VSASAPTAIDRLVRFSIKDSQRAGLQVGRAGREHVSSIPECQVTAGRESTG
jgi:hypothetical protein